jgi:hypothetical protein
MALISLAGLASGAVIDFNSVVNGSANADRTTPLTTQGYTFTSAHFHINDTPGACAFGGCTTLNGTQYLNLDAPQLGQPVVMTRAGGGSFNLNSLQASRLFVDGTASALLNFPNADTLELVGELSGGGTVSVSISLPALPSFNSFSLPGTFINLLSLTISGSVDGVTDNASWAVDNIDVSDVPEPSTVLFAAGGALLLGLRKYHQ